MSNGAVIAAATSAATATLLLAFLIGTLINWILPFELVMWKEIIVIVILGLPLFMVIRTFVLKPIVYKEV